MQGRADNQLNNRNVSKIFPAIRQTRALDSFGIFFWNLRDFWNFSEFMKFFGILEFLEFLNFENLRNLGIFSEKMSES